MSTRQCTRSQRGSRGQIRTRAQSRTLESAMTLPNIPESLSQEQQDAEEAIYTETQPYRLRTNRAPRYKCGTCGSRICSCVNEIVGETTNKRLARGVDVSSHELDDKGTRAFPQCGTRGRTVGRID